MSDATVYDGWLADDGPVALVIREWLMPVEGTGVTFFPATYAPQEGADRDPKKFQGGYNIDTHPDGTSICQVDSVGSQANRIEPIFGKPGYAGLVPRVVVRANEREVDLLDAGHRAADALVRSSGLQAELNQAFRQLLRGDATPLAKIAPTSLVFGAWDSRDTGAKVPRLLASTIRAFDVYADTRSANFLPQQRLDYMVEGLLPEPANKAEKDEYSKQGYLNALASASPGGVRARGGIRRDASLSLAALRLLTAGRDEAATRALRRYILGLSLVAFTYPVVGFYRQGCQLVMDPDKADERVAVHPDGRREPFALKHPEAIAFARATIGPGGFTIGEDKTVDFARSAQPAEAAEPAARGRGRGRRAGTNPEGS